MKVFRGGLAVLGATAVAVSLAAGAAGAAPGPDRVDLPGAVPAFARTASPVVVAATSRPVSVRVALRLRDAADAEAQVLAITDPTSPKYEAALEGIGFYFSSGDHGRER